MIVFDIRMYMLCVHFCVVYFVTVFVMSQKPKL